MLVGLPGADLDADTRRELEDVRPAGVILFRRNLDTPERLATLIDRLRSVLDPPVLFAIDQEGGRVSRLEPWIGPTPDWSASRTRSLFIAHLIQICI